MSSTIELTPELEADGWRPIGEDGMWIYWGHYESLRTVDLEVERGGVVILIRRNTTYGEPIEGHPLNVCGWVNDVDLALKVGVEARRRILASEPFTFVDLVKAVGK